MREPGRRFPGQLVKKGKLFAIDAEPLGEDVIERLEYVLALAELGELSSVGIVWVTRSGETASTWSKLPSVPLLLGGVSRLAHRLNRLMDE